jgi:anti-sigma factor RsiW
MRRPERGTRTRREVRLERCVVVTTQHPEAERLAALIDGRLTADEAASVRQHVADCPDCFDVVSGTLEFQAAEKRLPVPILPWRRLV